MYERQRVRSKFMRLAAILVAFAVVFPSQLALTSYALDEHSFTYTDDNISVEVDVNAGALFTDV